MEKFFSQLRGRWHRQLSRRKFVKIGLGWLAGIWASQPVLKAAFANPAVCGPRPKRTVPTPCDLAVAKGKDPYKNTVAVIAALGGMQKFVRKNDVVVVKPNIGWDRTPEQAANTNPAVVAALVELCYQAGAKRVNVFDVTCNDPRRCYENSGIQQAAKEKGAEVYLADTWNALKAQFPYPSLMEGWPILRDAVVCDTFINVPVLKHHGLTGLTLSMKNLMGVCGGTRGLIHIDIGKKLVDLTDFIHPELTVIDATRMLVRNGPSGGSLDDVIQLDTVFASTDATLADAFACQMVKKDPMSVQNLKEAVGRGLGNADVSKAKILALKT